MINTILCIASIISGVMTVAAGVLWQIYTRGSFIPVILGLYLIIIGAFIMIAEVVNPPKLQYMIGFYTTWFGKAIVQALVGIVLIIPYVDVQQESVKGYTSISFIVSCIYNLLFAVFLIVMGVLSLFKFHTISMITPMMEKKKKKKQKKGAEDTESGSEKDGNSSSDDDDDSDDDSSSSSSD